MNAVDIFDAVSTLADEPFDTDEFPYSFLAAFPNKETTLKRLRSGSTNSSDVPGGVLQRDKIHIATCAPGEVNATFKALKGSRKTAAGRAKFILATDGVQIEAEDLVSGEALSCPFGDMAEHFGFFLSLAGISAIREIKNNPIDVKATAHLNKLYMELCRHNTDWTAGAQFMARLIFCCFAEDTGIFPQGLFTTTIGEMTDPSAVNTHEVLSELFRAMDIKAEDRAGAGLKPWAEKFPYVNGGLFTDAGVCPKFSRTARSYLLRVGELRWKEINPDIFGSMIQAIADPDERGSLGMHYTSVPNILKVLNPLFLDDLRAQLEAASDNSRKLRNLRRRIASIRVFDPACGSGNFLVIAYRQMREIEAEIIRRLGDEGETQIRLENFFGIEIKPFPVEIAKLSLLIAEFQCDVRFRGERIACLNVLPLHRTGQILVDNAMRRNWFEICPPSTASQEGLEEWDLGGPTGRMALEENKLGERREAETYICGNPPYKGSQDQTDDQKLDLAVAFAGRIKSTKSADYVSGWFIKATDYIRGTRSKFAFVTTNSINQGRQVSLLWPTLLSDDLEIFFAVPSFLWSNLASKKAAVTVSVVGMQHVSNEKKSIYVEGLHHRVDYIGAYLVPNHKTIVAPARKPLFAARPMQNGSMPNDGGGLLVDPDEFSSFVSAHPEARGYFRKFIGSDEAISGEFRYCLWLDSPTYNEALRFPFVHDRVEIVRKHREGSTRETTNDLASMPYAFGEIRHSASRSLLIPRHSAEDRPYLPSVPVTEDVVVADSAIFLPSFEMEDFAIYSSRMHLVWIATVCGKIKTDFRYSNTLGWNTFPFPALTENKRAELARCAADILVARERHFPKTLADLYDPEHMPPDLRSAHDRNDEELERAYIGRRFRNDTERLEKLFELYEKATAPKPVESAPKRRPKARAKS